MNHIRFPREVPIFILYLDNLVSFAGSFLVMVVVLMIYGYFPTWRYILLILPMGDITLITLGAMFILGGVGVFVRDLPSLVNPLMRLLFFVSGVIFSLESIPDELSFITVLNPIMHYLEMFRGIVLYNENPNWSSVLLLFALGFLFSIFGYRYFKSKEAVFADYE